MGSVQRGCRFNPVLGFLSVATRASDRGPRGSSGVSIPCWVFCPSRRVVGPTGRRSAVPFQSRAGFSVRRDTKQAEVVEDTQPGFNPVLGFLSVATVPRIPEQTSSYPVSIPCWVFCPSRHSTLERHDTRSTRFNPVLGFLSVATYINPGLFGSFSCFNPVLGFLSVATIDRSRVRKPRPWFQSRAGFSVRRDVELQLSSGVHGCFNPVLGFLSVATWECRLLWVE